MSIKAMQWAWSLSIGNSTDKLVLMALADEADDFGRNCFPSHKRIAAKTSKARETVIRSIARLREAGYLTYEHHTKETKSGKRRQTSNRYFLQMDRGDENAPPIETSEKVTPPRDCSVTPPRDCSVTRGVTPASHHYPLLTPEKNPLKPPANSHGDEDDEDKSIKLLVETFLSARKKYWDENENQPATFEEINAAAAGYLCKHSDVPPELIAQHVQQTMEKFYRENRGAPRNLTFCKESLKGAVSVYLNTPGRFGVRDGG